MMSARLHRTVCNQRSQSGVALISMLLIFALVVILVGAAAKRDQLMIRRISLQLQQSGAAYNALAGEIIARQRLAEDWAAQQKNNQQSDHLNDDWATPQTLTTDKGQVLVQIRDLHGCFNLNNLVAASNTENAEGEKERANKTTLTINTTYLARLKRLLEELDLDTDTDEVLSQLADWLDSDTQAQDGGAEEAPAGQQANANRTLEHISELAIFASVPFAQQTTLYQRLCAVPLDAAGKATSINPNTASALLLSSWEKGLSGPAIISGREASEQGYMTTEDFLSHKSNAGIALQAGDFSIRSDYFEAVIQADFSNQTRYLTSRLYRNPNNGQITTLARHYSYSPSHLTLTNHQAIDESNP